MTSFIGGVIQRHCLTAWHPSKVDYIMKEIHEGIYGNHSWGQSFAFKSLRQGYYWVMMKSDCLEFAKKCDRCQHFAPMSKSHLKELTIMTSPWPFIVQGIDLIGQLPKGRVEIICSGRSWLLHKVGRSRSTSINHTLEDQIVHLQKHHLSIWSAIYNHIRQWQIVWSQWIQGILGQPTNQEVILLSCTTIKYNLKSQWSSWSHKQDY